jgi:hypothetical protein
MSRNGPGIRLASEADYDALSPVFAEAERYHREALPHIFRAPQGQFPSPSLFRQWVSEAGSARPRTRPCRAAPADSAWATPAGSAGPRPHLCLGHACRFCRAAPAGSAGATPAGSAGPRRTSAGRPPPR